MWILGLILLRHIGNYLYFSLGTWITNEIALFATTFVSSFLTRGAQNKAPYFNF